MASYVQKIVQNNIVQILVGIVTILLAIIGFFVTTQLFEQSTNSRIDALEKHVVTFDQDSKTINDISAKVDVLGTKIDNIADRQDRQGTAISDLRNSLR